MNIDMSVQAISLTLLLLLLVLLATGFPVALCLLAISIIGILVWIRPGALAVLASLTFKMSTLDYLIAIPLYIFMATLLESSGIASAMYEAMYKWFAGLKGGLAMGTVLICTLIAALSGVAATATILMGVLAYPEMMKRGYNKRLAIGCITGGGCLGPLIPPSIPMILIASLSSISIGKLFISGVFPGLLAASLFILYIFIVCSLKPQAGPPAPPSERSTWREKLSHLKKIIAPVFLIILVLGLIYTGISTPTEAGGIGAFGALICTALFGRLTLGNLKRALTTALKINSMLYSF
jgi:tripartite ATP-independent transporter DctM subunit